MRFLSANSTQRSWILPLRTRRSVRSPNRVYGGLHGHHLIQGLVYLEDLRGGRFTSCRSIGQNTACCPITGI